MTRKMEGYVYLITADNLEEKIDTFNLIRNKFEFKRKDIKTIKIIHTEKTAFYVKQKAYEDFFKV